MQQQGTVKQILPIETGAKKDGGTWSKQIFTIEFKDGSYDKLLALSVMKPELLANIGVGETVTVDFNLSSREYNGKFYTDASSWKIVSAGSASPIPAPLDQQGLDLPF